MSSRLYKDIGFVFRLNDLGETDRIVSIFTKYHGRVDAVAKGVRNISSKKAGSIDLINLARFAFARGSNLDIVTEVELVDDYSSLKQNLPSQFVLFYLCELLDKFMQVGEKDLDAYSLLFLLLDELLESESRLALHAFELKLMTSQGFEPNLSSCLGCGKPFETLAKRYLAADDIGMYCDQEHSSTHLFEVSDRTLKSLRFLLEKPFQQAARLDIDVEEERLLKRIITNWLEFIFEKELRSKKYL